MNNKPEHTADISAELHTLSRSAECCELQPKVFGKPIAQYLAELANRIDAATEYEAMRIKEAIAYLERVGETGDGRLHFGDLMRIENAKVMLKIVIALRKAEPTAHNGGSAPQTVYNTAAMHDALENLVYNIELRASVFDVFSIVDRKTFLDAKSALAAPPHEAKWTANGGYEFACCSNCGHLQYAGWDSRAEQAEKIGDFHELYKFCPNCGAQMKGATDGK